jgi:hypothetical protein
MMKVSPHFLRLYYKTARRYKKLTKRLKKQVSTGEFQQKSDYYRKEFFFQLDKLRKKLLSLRGQVKLAAAAGVTALVLSATSANAQIDGVGPFQETSREKNPLPPPISFGDNTTPLPVDLDKDGDMDLIVGTGGPNYYGYHIRYFRNMGTKSVPLFREEEYYRNPFFYLLDSFNRDASPAIGDIDGDGDLDLVVGLSSGEVKYFRNQGQKDADEGPDVYMVPDFVEETGPYEFVDADGPGGEPGEGTGHPFDGFQFGDDVAPHIVDIDKDGDVDVFFGAGYGSYGSYDIVRLFVNDGEGNFSEQELTGVNPFYYGVTIATLDVNGDGALDIVTGDKYGNLELYYRNGFGPNDELKFDKQLGANNLFGEINHLFNNAAPAFVNFDNDADYDLLIGDSKYGSGDLHFYQNSGSFSFEEEHGLISPVGGVRVNSYASPEYFLDENGVPSIVIGSGSSTDGQTMKLYKKFDEFYEEIPEEDNPFANLSIGGRFTPSLVDLDGDSDGNSLPDLVGANGSELMYFKNNNGVYEYVALEDGPFSGVTMSDGHSEFADVDDDGDYDLFIGDYYYDINSGTGKYFIRYYQNQGDSNNPIFAEVTKNDPDWPFANLQLENYPLYPSFVDIDHDGDLDAVIGEGGYWYEGADPSRGAQRVLLFENYGPGTGLYHNSFEGYLIGQYDGAEEPSSQFIDIDNDGDDDVLTGDASGIIKFFENANPAPVTTIHGTSVVFEETSGELLIDSHATITDGDNDEISKLTVTISNFTPSDTLVFHWPIIDESNHSSYEFDDVNGQLTIIGKQSQGWYQAILQSLKFQFDILSPGVAPRRTGIDHGAPHTAAAATKDLTIRVFDVDGTAPIPRIISVSIGNAAPVITDTPITGPAGSLITVDLKPLVSDEDADVALTYTVIGSLTSGAVASISSSQVLTIDYSGLAFFGTEDIEIQACDTQGACSSNVFTINITNTAPVFADAGSVTVAGGIATIDLSTILTDTDNNLVMSTLEITGAPGSGAAASFDSNNNLVVDYTGKTFTGSEQVTLKACDITGTCDTSTITITVTNTPPTAAARIADGLAGGIVTIDLMQLISDPDNNLILSTLKVKGTPVSGAPTSIDANGKLSIDYTGLNFTGNDIVTFEVCDAAGICAENTITINIPNTAPVLSAGASSIGFGKVAKIALLPLLTDAENNIDVASIRVVNQPASGAATSIDANQNLVVDYTNRPFAGTELITVEACDLGGICAQNVFSITVNNEAPIINAIQLHTSPGSSVSIDLFELASDSDDNLDINAFIIVSPPESGALAEIANGRLNLNYAGIIFKGTDRLTIRACDKAGACSLDAVISIDVHSEAEVEVFNAVAPNGSSADNRYLHISGLPEKHKVTIFNRWGDKVYETVKYDNEKVRFEGRNDNGNELASGTYFYVVEFEVIIRSTGPSSATTTDRRIKNGYLTLKQ